MPAFMGDRSAAARLAAILLFLCIALLASRAAIAQEKTFAMTITDGALAAPQRLMRVTKDDMVRLRVTSNAAGELHLHAYRVELKLAPGRPVETSFKAYASGRFPLEWHGAADKGKPARRHDDEFAVLEVYPK